jgi:hypothetical protein
MTGKILLTDAALPLPSSQRQKERLDDGRRSSGPVPSGRDGCADYFNVV